MLRSYASCAEEIDASLHCARCHTYYCSRPCQKAHWASGHKKSCAGIARARRDTDLEAQCRALAHISHMGGGAPDEAHCLMCLDRGDTADPLLRGCACRGSSGWTHVGCLIKMAEAAPAQPAPPARFAPWDGCSTCNQAFTGLVQLQLAIALWAKYARLLETHEDRISAAVVYAAALSSAGEHAEATRIFRGILDVHTRMLGPDHLSTLDCATNLGSSLVRLGECAEAVVLPRTALTVRTRTAGADEQGALTTEGLLVNALLDLEEYAEAEVLGRVTLEKRRRIYSRDNRETLMSSGNLASSLSGQGKFAAAVDIQREVLVSTTRLLGAEHEHTLISASNMAVSLSECGREAECEQLLRDMLALARRALDPNHRITLSMLDQLRELGSAAQ